jgi:hypothetical protein
MPPFRRFHFFATPVFAAPPFRSRVLPLVPIFERATPATPRLAKLLSAISLFAAFMLPEAADFRRAAKPLLLMIRCRHYAIIAGFSYCQRHYFSP